MRIFARLVCAIAVLSLAVPSLSAHAGEATVAVAANFLAPMKQLALRFERASGHTLVLSSGSTGKFYAQIRNGAPFDVLLAADDETPARLLREGDAVRTQTYAVGRLALWSADASKIDGSDTLLRRGSYTKFAVANPRLAPYGAAAMQVLYKLGLAESAKAKFVMGENIGQTHHFVASGNADIGFVALSQVWQDGRLTGGSAWLVPPALHAPIRQDAALLKRGAANPAAAALLDFLKSPEATAVIRSYGYEL
jgi:molybdate transport system substrate-binding protein